VVPLQSPPQPGPAVATLLGLVLVAGVVGAVGSAVMCRLPNPVGKYRLLYAVVLFPATLVAYGVLASLGFGAALVAALPPVPDPVAALLGSYAEFLAAGLVFLAAYAPTVRGVRAVRDIELSTRAALAKMARYVVGLSAVVTLVVAPLDVASADLGPVGVALGIVALGVGFLAVSPWVLPLLRTTREPSGGTADRLAALRSRAGLDVRDARILDTDDEETADALVRGVPGYRRLFVTSTFLEAFDDDTAAALLAVEDGRLRSRVLELRVGTVAVAGVALVASVSGAGPRWPTLALSVAALLVGFGLSRRGIRVADDRAADRVGARTVAAALDRYAAVHGMEPSRRRFPNPLSVSVPLGDRIDRLRDRDRVDDDPDRSGA
jgi:STE24 endopeptidase